MILSILALPEQPKQRDNPISDFFRLPFPNFRINIFIANLKQMLTQNEIEDCIFINII